MECCWHGSQRFSAWGAPTSEWNSLTTRLPLRYIPKLEPAHPDAELDGPISPQEIQLAVKELKKGKACGVDGVINEILKYGGSQMEEAIWKLVQIMFELEQIPRDWAKGIIFPIYKDGDERVPDNYRGITLLSVVGKLYSTVITKRVSEWCEDNHKISDEQAGFRPNRATTDQIFT